MAARPAACVPGGDPRGTELIHLGIQLPTAGISWPELRAAATRVESLGFDSLWLPDHLVAWEGAIPRLETWQALAGIAGATRRILIGPLVSPVTFRHPVLLAKMAATLDHMSGGRVILGLGTGGMGREHRMFGLPRGALAERNGRLAEAVAIIRGLLDEPVTTFRGAHYRIADAQLEPKPLQPRLPILVAGSSPATIRLAADAADWWNVIALPLQFEEKVRWFRAHVAEAGRPAEEVTATASLRVIIRDDRAAIDRRVGEMDPTWREDPYRIIGDARSVAQQLAAYGSAGADRVIVQVPAPIDHETLERLATDVAAAIR